MTNHSFLVAEASAKSYPVVGIVPAYRPDEKLVEVVRECLDHTSLARIVVVDDGGGDEYLEVFRRLSGLAGVSVLHLAVNGGKGGAIKLAFQYALYECPEAKGFVTFDADGQHCASDIQRVVECFMEAPAVMTAGVRDFHDPALHIPFRSRFGNLFTEMVFRLFTGVRVVDTQTGLRCYPRSLAEKCTQIKYNRYEFEQEALLMAADENGCRQVSIRTIYEDGNKCSHFSPIRDTIRIYSVFLRFAGVPAICMALDYVVFAALHLSGLQLLISMLGARLLSLAVNLGFNRRKALPGHGNAVVRFAGFATQAACLFAISYFGVSWMKQTLQISPLISKVVVELGLFSVYLAVKRFWGFGRKR